MFVLLLKSFLEKTGSISRCLVVCCGLLLLVNGADGGTYRRTKDGKTLVWNNYPSEDDVVSWSGKRDANGYATGNGTLTWYRTEKDFQTGSMLPAKGPVVVISRYTGKMVRGKLDGPVLNVDANGKTFQLRFVDGVNSREQHPETTPTPAQPRHERLSGIAATSAPAEGPALSPTLDEPTRKRLLKGMMAEGTTATNSPAAPAASSAPAASVAPVASDSPAEATPAPSATAALETPVVEVASIRSPIASQPGPAEPAPAPPSPPAPTPDSIENEVKERIIADFKEETLAVLLQVGEATGNFHGVDRLDSVGKLPTPVSESVSSLVQRARDFRARLGYETALRDYRSETETVDALSAVEQVTRSIASNDVSEASGKLGEFLKNNPEPIADNQKPLWQYLNSMRQMCSRLEKDADLHSQRAQSLAAAGRTSEAIREYQEAYRMFPNPATAEKIRQLQSNSLGL